MIPALSTFWGENPPHFPHTSASLAQFNLFGFYLSFIKLVLVGADIIILICRSYLMPTRVECGSQTNLKPRVHCDFLFKSTIKKIDD